ncbi:hypothetical protein PVAP13_9KG388600 [Panicum virgatum]|uniref:Uncharacterized protein n=1 Tax=Panicum virgatum TaxID=38727 RepID=A0A8T0NPE5_PANVG|nr:hypothetical protein PVAP13_9KG388600 [Panicum virgatum]
MRNHKLAPTPSSSSKNNKVEQPHLSGAYIRSLVKQLSSSSAARSKDHSTMGAKPHAQPQQEDQQQQAQTAPPQQQQPHKKQVRRRLHTSRPYQERLLNVAEARREIVTALKIHRASMRQAKEQQQQQQLMQLQLQQQQEVHHLVEEQSQAATRASAPISYTSYSDYLYNSPFSHFSSPSSYSSPLTYQQTPVAPMVNSEQHNLDHHLVPLPAQPLGLNLSFQGFNSFVGDDMKNSACSFDPPLLQPSPTSSYSVYSSPSVTMASHDLSAVTMENTSLAEDASLHRVLDEEEMAAIYSIGQQHDIEWSDTMNLVTSAWWSKLLESIEDKGNATPGQEVGGGSANTMEDPLAHIPGLFGDNLDHEANEESSSNVPGMHLNDYYHHNVDVSMPGMEIGEIEGWNAEWFS